MNLLKLYQHKTVDNSTLKQEWFTTLREMDIAKIFK
jgi:hypothetical protein